MNQIEEHAPDVILLDLDLPDVKGIDTLIQVKTVVDSSKTKIIIFSNNADDNVRQKAVDNGAAAFFVKAETNLEDIVSFIER